MCVAGHALHRTPRVRRANLAQLVTLERLPLYSVSSYPNRYWTQQRNTTEWHLYMAELTSAGNALARLMLQDLAPTLPGAHVGMTYRSPWVFFSYNDLL